MFNDSDNAEVASKIMQNVVAENTSNTYSITNEVKYDADDAMEQHMFYKQFVVWCCNGCSIASLTADANNPIF